jgi:predicted enzyme related to lactoylglutathione lyase
MPNPFVHIELNTSDVPAAKKFYRGLFDWQLVDQKMGAMTYTMIGVGKGTGGGMMQKPMPEAPTQWLSYVEVDDVTKTIAKAKKLGAQIIVDRMEVPDAGVLGIFIDPTGAALGVWQPTPKAPAKRPAAKKAAAKKPAAKRKK